MDYINVDKLTLVKKEDITRFQIDLQHTLTRQGFKYYSFSPVEHWRNEVKAYWAGFRSPMFDVLGPVKDALNWFYTNTIQPALLVLENSIKLVIAAVKTVVDSIKTVVNSIKTTVEGLFTSIVTSITSSLRAINTLMTSLFASVISKITSVYNALYSFPSIILTGISATMSGIAEKVSLGLGAVFKPFEGILSSIRNAITGAFTAFGMEIKGYLSLMGKWFFEQMRNSLSIISDILVWVYDNVIKPAIAVLKNVVMTVGNTLLDMCRGVWTSIKRAMFDIAGVGSPSILEKWGSVIIGIAAVGIVGTLAIEGLNIAHPVKKILSSELIHQMIAYGGGTTISSMFFNVVLQNVMATPLRYELDYYHPVNRADIRNFTEAWGRFFLSKPTLYRELQYMGIDPNADLEPNEDGSYPQWYTRESLGANPFEPDKWELYDIDTTGKMMEHLGDTPASYFILNAAATSGFYNREMFKKALQDSSYGPLPMAIILQACEAQMVKRHMTKFEDELNEARMLGDIDRDEHYAGVMSIYNSEEIATKIVTFFDDREILKTKRASRYMLQRAFIAGRIDDSAARLSLQELGYKPKAIDLILMDFQEKASEHAELSRSEMLRMLKAGIRDYDDVYGTLLSIGYVEKDANDLCSLYLPAAAEEAS